MNFLIVRNELKKNKAAWIIYSFMLFLLFASSLFLFFRMSYDRRSSDFAAHLAFAQSPSIGYSLNEFVYRLIFLLPYGKHFLASLYLSILVTATPLALIFLFKTIDKYYLKNENDLPVPVIGILTFPLIFMTSFVVPILYVHYYKNAISLNCWHNPTYLTMRFFVIIALSFYLKIRSYYSNKSPFNKTMIKDYGLFALFLFLATACKPSFMLSFLLAVVIVLLVELLFNFKNIVFWKKSVCMALAFLPAGLIVLAQNFITYGVPEATNKVIFSPFTVFLHNAHIPVLMFPLFLLFPVSIFVFNICNGGGGYRKNLLKDKYYLDVAVNWIIAALIYLCLAEDGNRMFHGNFSWGMLMGDFLFYAVSYFVFICNVRFCLKNFNQVSAVRKIFLAAISFVFVYQSFTGVMWYLSIILGKSYYF